MDDAGFWVLIQRLDWDRLGDDDLVCEPVVAALAAMPAAEIRSFQNILCRKLFELDREDIARESGPDIWSETYVSADGFLDARCVVVANGQWLFDAVLWDPTQMPKDGEFEALLSIAPIAYERKTGEPYDDSLDPSYETCSNRDGWPGPPGQAPSPAPPARAELVLHVEDPLDDHDMARWWARLGPDPRAVFAKLVRGQTGPIEVPDHLCWLVPYGWFRSVSTGEQARPFTHDETCRVSRKGYTLMPALISFIQEVSAGGRPRS